MDDNNKNITNRGKAEIAGKDIVETIARSESASLGGKAGTKLFDSAINTRHGQKSLEKVANNKIVNRGPLVRTFLANNQDNINRTKTSMMGMTGSSLGSSILDDGDQIKDTGNNIAGDSTSNNTIKGSGIVKGLFKKLSLKNKLLLFSAIGSFGFLVIFIIILITPLMELGIIDISDIGSSVGSGGISSGGGGYVSVPSSINYWWPVDSNNTRITSPYGQRFHPIEKKYKMHNGIDIGINGGTTPGKVNILASNSGTVTKVHTGCPTTNSSDDDRTDNECGGRYGNYVFITHSDGKITVYAHLYSVSVSLNSTVTKGQVIGTMGSSGNSTGPHLHFEVRVNGNRENPTNYVSITNRKP